MSVLLGVQNISKAFGPRPLFVDLTLDLRAGEKIGLIGPNGAGKSTLLKILADLELPDDGQRIVRKGGRIGYVAQDDTFPEGQTVLQVLLTQLAEDGGEAHEHEVLAAKTLTQFGFVDQTQRADTLSGGWRKRLALARQIVRAPDFLLLDEPTNHLDLPGIVWLEKLLRSASFGYLVSTHDRAFLQAVAEEVMEINRAYPSGYFRSPGSYDDFYNRRQEFLEGQAKLQESVANIVRRETEWLGRKAAARTRKAGFRIDQAMQRQEQLAELKYRNAAAGTAGIDFATTGRQSRKLLVAEGIKKSLGGKLLFQNVEMLLSPGSKVGLLGPNGSGKSTLLRVLTRALPPDEGTVTHAEGLRVVMFEQGRSALDPNVTLRTALCPNGDSINFRDKKIHVAAWAKQFLFQPEQLDLMVGSLSGGEQARVRMAQLMTEPADLLCLDEPTNDLDIPALEVLEESLTEFPGAILIVSHDRELLDRICTEVIGLDGAGGSALYGSVEQWLRAYERSLVDKEKARKATETKATEPAKITKPQTKKLSYKEKQELGGMENAILEAEEEVQRFQEEVQKVAGDHVALAQACQKLEEAQHKVEKLYARWSELEERA